MTLSKRLVGLATLLSLNSVFAVEPAIYELETHGGTVLRRYFVPKGNAAQSRLELIHSTIWHRPNRNDLFLEVRKLEYMYLDKKDGKWQIRKTYRRVRFYKNEAEMEVKIDQGDGRVTGRPGTGAGRRHPPAQGDGRLRRRRHRGIRVG